MDNTNGENESCIEDFTDLHHHSPKGPLQRQHDGSRSRHRRYCNTEQCICVGRLWRANHNRGLCNHLLRGVSLDQWNNVDHGVDLDQWKFAEHLPNHSFHSVSHERDPVFLEDSSVQRQWREPSCNDVGDPSRNVKCSVGS
jgi:hypothetical protein